MNKRILSVLLALCLVLSLVPMTALAEENEQRLKTTITSVDELLQFAKAVDNGEYDDKTDAVVSLDADLDLTGVAWKPIGSVFDDEGNLLHYFSGKFYGNGHIIFNLDFSDCYGKDEYPSSGFFSEIYGAEVSGLTVQGKTDVSNANYIFFGTIAGVAVDSKISDCTSDVSFTDTSVYINGTVAMCGYAVNTTVEYCQNKGDFSITKDTTPFWMGGIVGFAENSTVQYCVNTGDITSWTPYAGGIVGQLYQNSKIINCYSSGTIVPLGKGTTDVGGIAGGVGAGTEIRHCYFSGKFDLTNYTAVAPYKRLGGISGGVTSDTPSFENNYCVETENVTACSKYVDAGTAKTLEYMKSEDFYKEITASGGNYRLNPNGTPLLPAPKYGVSFAVTPAELANVVIKVNGQEVTSPVNLEAGTYTVEVSADNCGIFTSSITITADTATHTQSIAMTYLPADYTRVDEAIAKANALTKEDYEDFSAVETAVNAVVRGKNFTQQDEVDAMAKAIEDAIAALVRKETDHTKTCPSAKFTDVNTSEWYHEAVDYVVENGLFAGTSDTTFTPGGSMTRGMLVTGLWRMAGRPEAKAPAAFRDVDAGQYYAEAVAWAAENGIVAGISETAFAPNAKATREQLAAILYRYAKWSGVDVTKTADLASFPDAGKVSAYAEEPLAWAVANGIVSGTLRGGKAYLDPQGSATRAQAASMLMRYAKTFA